MKNFLKNNLLILSIYFITVCVALFFIVSFDKKDIHIFLNQFVGLKPIDLFFSIITYFGDGTVAVFMLAAILIFNFRLGLYSTASFLSAALFSIGLKRLFFDDVNRPFYVFNYFTNYKLKLVDGVDIFIHNSFPSGHATQAFAILMCLAFTTTNKTVKLILMLVALLTAYSRVYLSQHWLADVTAGSFIGMSFSLFYYYLITTWPLFDRLNKPIYVFIRLWRKR